VSIFFFVTIFLSNLSQLEQSGRKGRITWGKIKTDPKSLINPEFLLKTKLGNPTRMSLKDISAYWNHWISKDKEGDPFSFLDDSSVKGESDDASDKSDDDGVGEGGADKPSVIPPDHFSIDHKIPSPILCDTPNSRTNCLQKLVSKGDQTSKTFHTLVKLVDAFGVSFIIRHTISIISYIF